MVCCSLLAFVLVPVLTLLIPKRIFLRVEAWHPDDVNKKKPHFMRSLFFAISGLRDTILRERNFRIHIGIAIAVALLALFLAVPIEFTLWLALAISLVWITELMNTSLEAVCDALTIEENHLIKRAKDVSAAAVLVATIFAVLVGLCIFAVSIVNILH